MMHRTLVIAASVLLLSGCAASSPAPKPTRMIPAADGGSYGSIADLQKAIEKAGVDCSEWEQTNAVTLAAESATCTHSTNVATFASSADLDTSVSNIKDVMTLIGGVKMLVGKNWFINGDAAPGLRSKLGGALVDTTTE